FRPQHLHRFANWRGVQHLVSFHMCIPAKFAELIKNPVGIGLVMRRTNLVWLGGHPFQPAELVLGAELGVEALFQCAPGWSTLRQGLSRLGLSGLLSGKRAGKNN